MKNVQRVDPRESTVNNNAAIDHNNVSSGNLTDHQALDINSQVDHVMYKQVTYEDLFSSSEDDDDDDQEDVAEISRKETIGIGSTKKADKGKQPVKLKRKNDQHVPCSKKKQENKTRISWKGELEDKFRVAMRELGDQAQSREIVRHMNMPGLTRHHVASHLQKYRIKQKTIEANIAAIAQKRSNLQLQSFANEDNESNVRSKSHMRTGMINLVGSSYVSIDNIRVLLREALPLPLPIRNFGDIQIANINNGGQGTESQLMGHGYGNAMQPQVTCDIYSNHAFEEAMARYAFGVPLDGSVGAALDNDLSRTNLE
ncbi:hypothetical protein QVD17_31897 [Tagetes erecta]|uniref:HTH myb-type domain-containing protein n=1 Tax=Tagetes erecta TaxID=13708 RepID=A0AAD8K496_TARER|nr:hypothetical protein QVD17_31897 [Tagetes erecta]